MFVWLVVVRILGSWYKVVFLLFKGLGKRCWYSGGSNEIERYVWVFCGVGRWGYFVDLGIFFFCCGICIGFIFFFELSVRVYGFLSGEKYVCDVFIRLFYINENFLFFWIIWLIMVGGSKFWLRLWVKWFLEIFFSGCIDLF